ncbi:GNAT family N-acetyltransferase [Paenibacillus filicis]|uniref:GNAT family N-acetyltransferase n=1 Tax=Paenibacillus filicis TaxID=669464 RepID=A0ABU9DMQ3_9BACL
MTDIMPIVQGTPEEGEYIRNQLIKFNAQHAPGRYEPINLAIKAEDGRVVGGLLAALCWNWVEVHILWVDESLRGQNYGSRLLQQIEQIAREKACTLIKLDTFSFQAPDFYRKHGYSEFGVLEDAPQGFQHYYFKKDLR